MSRIDTAVVSVFIGGQLEIQNLQEGYLFRGEVASAEVAGNTLRVTFKWLAQAVGDIPRIEKWVDGKRKCYEAHLSIFAVSDSGPGNEGGDRLCLTSTITGETITFFPADGCGLDPARVEGLVLS